MLSFLLKHLHFALICIASLISGLGVGRLWFSYSESLSANTRSDNLSVPQSALLTEHETKSTRVQPNQVACISAEDADKIGMTIPLDNRALDVINTCPALIRLRLYKMIAKRAMDRVDIDMCAALLVGVRCDWNSPGGEMGSVGVDLIKWMTATNPSLSFDSLLNQFSHNPVACEGFLQSFLTTYMTKDSAKCIELLMDRLNQNPQLRSILTGFLASSYEANPEVVGIPLLASSIPHSQNRFDQIQDIAGIARKYQPEETLKWAIQLPNPVERNIALAEAICGNITDDASLALIQQIGNLKLRQDGLRAWARGSIHANGWAHVHEVVQTMVSPEDRMVVEGILADAFESRHTDSIDQEN